MFAKPCRLELDRAKLSTTSPPASKLPRCRVVETQWQQGDFTAALPQILAYMMAGLSGNEPIFGLVTNGDEFVFVKLCREGMPQYDISDSFLLLPRRNKFQEVLQVLKRLGRLAIS
ncbi:MAG: hypothetical protein ICV63_05385 [Coleofasciculus sp. Co-bin14]|nr:hypothetical protein [Coleofasciculus sp. Co-bin14]